MIIKNAQTLPKVYYGLHFSPGVAEYREPGQEPYRIFINESTIKNMDPTFAGRPVYVKHVDSVELDKLQEEADGYVSESFYNSADGKHWVKFIVVSDKGHEAIRSGWRLSNAYVPKQMGPGGLWHGVEYSKEVTAGEYEHLAIVPNPRYDESIILTPEQFKDYNEQKQSEIKRLANSKTPQGVKSMFSFFKRSKVENSDEFASMIVTLPKSGKEMTISQLINAADEMEQKKNEAPAEKEEKKENEEAPSDEELKKNKKNGKKKNEEASEEKKENEDEEEKKENEDPSEEKKENEESSEEEKKKKENEDEEKKEEAKKNALFESLKNAPEAVAQTTTVQLSMDQVARGKSRYGSGK